MVRHLSPLESLNEIQWSWVYIPLRPTLDSYIEESVSGQCYLY